MIATRLKRSPWMSEAGYNTLPWQPPHGNTRLPGAKKLIKKSDFKIYDEIYTADCAEFRRAFEKAILWKRLIA